jgi:transposase InsO family protein
VYGVRKLWHAARRAGIEVGRDQVGRLMGIAGIRGAVRGRHRTVTTRRADTAARHPVLVARDWDAPTAPDERWVAHFSYVWTSAGFCYVALVVDVFSRRILGWRVTSSKQTSLVTDALRRALHARSRTESAWAATGLVHHSDAGSPGGLNWSSQHLDDGGVDRQAGWMKELTGRSPMRLPGAPSHRREVEQTPTGCCASTFPRAPTYPDGAPRSSRRSVTHSTHVPERHSTGRPPPKRSTSTYSCFNKPVLRPPIESGQYLSIRYAERLAEAGITASVGTTGNSYDNAAAEALNRLFKTELVRRHGPWRTLEHVEFEVLEWVDWYNRERLHTWCDDTPPAEYEMNHYAAQDPTSAAAEETHLTLH